MNERINIFIQSLGITVAEFERSCSLSNGAVAKMGDNTRMSTIDKISNRYPSLNIVWLRTGEGPMLRSAEDRLLDMVDEERARSIMQQFGGHHNRQTVQQAGKAAQQDTQQEIALLKKMVEDKDREIEFLRKMVEQLSGK